MYTFKMCKEYRMKKSLLGSCLLAAQFPFQEATTNISGFLHILEISVLCIYKHITHMLAHIHWFPSMTDEDLLSSPFHPYYSQYFISVIVILYWLSFPTMSVCLYFLVHQQWYLSPFYVDGNIRNSTHPLFLPPSSSHFLAAKLL